MDVELERAAPPVPAGGDPPAIELKSLLGRLPAVVYVAEFGPEGRWLYLSSGIEDLLGYSVEEWMDYGGFWNECLHPEDRPVQLAREKQAMTTGERLCTEYRMVARDGRVVWVQDEAVVVEGPDGRPVLQGVMLDVTARIEERTRLEEELRQSQRMEAVGRLAGGVAHDFNNLLAVIQNYASFLAEDLAEGDPRREDAEEILRAGERAKSLTRQLLTFSRKEKIRPEITDLNEIVVDMQKLLHRTIGEDVHLRTRLEDDLWNVKVDRGQMEQLLANLAVNARDAMPDGGVLTIQTENLSVDEGWLTELAGESPERYVCITVSDTGRGISEEERAHIFEPFFTTKERGRGTGLGLATVHGIVQQAGGHISVYSGPDRGATFKTYLPVCELEEPAAPRRRARIDPAGGGGESVLVVEDEAAVRRLVERILVGKGYNVIAGGPQEALSVIESDAEVDVLLTDVVMPDISGKQVAERLRADRPHVPVIFMSGYTDNIIARQDLGRHGSLFIPKPFTASELLAVVRRALMKTRTAS